MSYKSMPFGKFKGVQISRVPTDYLKWCLDTIQFKKPELKTAIEHELLDRGNTGPGEDWSDFGPEPRYTPDDDIPF